MQLNANKTRVAVLYGGHSAEHEVSVVSAANVIQELDKNRFDVTPIGIDKKGNWFLGQDIFNLSLENKKIPEIDHLQKWFTPEWINKPSTQHGLSQVPAKDAPMFDVVFPAVHGSNCEDGRLQGLLELANLPYVGAGVLSSAINMDKDVTKRLAEHAGIPIVPYRVIKKKQWLAQKERLIEEMCTLGFPLFVKPANTGSSIGIEKVKRKEQLVSAVQKAFTYDHKILIEKAFKVVELEIAVLESIRPTDDPIVSVVGEIRPRHEFYTYEAKYVDEHGADYFIPAVITDEKKTEAQRLAKRAFEVLECEGMARVDLFLDQDTQQIFFNEINTIPGFTQISMYPKLMMAGEMTYSELLTHLIELAIQRHHDKQSLIKNYSN